MNDEQKFIFDLTGYLVIPEVISRAEAQEIKEQIRLMRSDPAQLPPAARSLPGGKIANLIDHPVVVDILKEIIGPELRLETCHTTWREYGQAASQGLHQGGPMSEPWFHYHVINGKIDAAMTRVVWELEDVGRDDALAAHAQLIRDLAVSADVGLADPYAAFERYVNAGGELANLLSWPNHPNRRGHELIVDELMRWVPFALPA